MAEVVTLVAFLDDYPTKRTDIKPTTRVKLKQTRDDLVAHFGADKPLIEITFADAKDWQRWLGLPANKDEPEQGGQGLSDNTVRRRCGIARQFFADALDDRLITENPFARMKGVSVRTNKGRYYFVSRDEADKVLAACPDAQWRLLFALSRYGGLRCPSEHLALRWGDVDWEHSRITVRSPKTEHHEGKGDRIIPLFPELRPHLQAVLDELLEHFDPKLNRLSEQPVITRYRDRNCNLRTQLCKIIRRAGLKPWPKLFQNLRSTRETELEETFPSHVVCAWLGNSPRIAAKHYLQVTAEHFAKATDCAAQKAAHNTTQLVGTDGNASETNCENLEKITNVRMPVVFEMGDAGLEPATSAL